MGASINFHTKTYLGSLRKVRKYAKALREELTEATENMQNTHGYLHEALQGLAKDAHELYLTAGDHEMMRDADLYIARREGMDAILYGLEEAIKLTRQFITKTSTTRPHQEVSHGD